MNLKLQEAYDGSTTDRWYFWLATKNYDDAPQKNPDHGSDGTEAPIDESFTSPFVGQSVDAAAEFLRNAPDTVDVERHFFAVLDDRTEKDGSVVMCRIGDMEGKGNKVECIRVLAKNSSLYLAGMEYGTWEEDLDALEMVGRKGKDIIN